MELYTSESKVHQCGNGHFVCGDCRPKIPVSIQQSTFNKQLQMFQSQRCPTCRSAFIGRAVDFEKILQNLNVCRKVDKKQQENKQNDNLRYKIRSVATFLLPIVVFIFLLTATLAMCTYMNIYPKVGQHTMEANATKTRDWCGENLTQFHQNVIKAFGRQVACTCIFVPRQFWNLKSCNLTIEDNKSKRLFIVKDEKYVSSNETSDYWRVPYY